MVGEDLGARRAGESEGSVARWSREFFQQLHVSLLPRMAHVTDTPEGELRYLGSRALRLWAFVGEHTTALARAR